MIKTRLLLVDDKSKERETHPEAIETVWADLFGEQIEVHACSDLVGDDAPPGKFTMAVSSVRNYDVVLLDVLWEKEDPHGIELAREIRRTCPDVPIVVFSRNVKRDHFKELIPIGIAAYLRKNEASAHPWCMAIRNVLAGVAKGRPGYPLFQLLKRRVKEVPEPWRIDDVMRAASRVWSDSNSYEKWNSFWDAWTVVLGKNNLKNACDALGKFFCTKELLMLSVHSAFRGHLEHVLHVYFTGYVLSHCDGFKELVLGAVHDLLGREFNAASEAEYWEWFQLCWLMVATLHDVAYPLEMLPDVVRVADEVRKTFGFAEFNGEIGAITPKGYNWESGAGKSGMASFRFVFDRLYKNPGLAVDIENKIKYVSKTGGHDVTRFNHGIASGVIFRAEVDKWTAEKGLPVEFLNWIVVAMGIHSLKNAAKDMHLTVSLKQDPLSFLLCLSDELQVWNRSRPDETMISSEVRSVELVGLSLDDKTLNASVEYDLFPLGDEARRSVAISNITGRLEKDQKVLGGFLKADPFEVVIRNKVRDPDTELPVIRLR